MKPEETENADEQEQKVDDSAEQAPKEASAEASNAGSEAEASSAEAAELSPEEMVEQLQKERELEREELLGKVLRAKADFENFRKRSLREKDELRKYAVSSLIEELLPALDNLDLGLDTADKHPEAKAVADGFRMVAVQLKSILQQNGLEELNPEGQDFDPNFHEAVTFQASDEVDDHKVMAVIRKGYALNGRVLRAANVVVSSGPADAESEKEA